jgi:hypothetical protein
MGWGGNPGSKLLQNVSSYLPNYTASYPRRHYILIYVGFEVLTAVIKNSFLFWDITPYSPLKVNRRFGRTCWLRLHGRRISRARKHRESRWRAEQSACRNFGLYRKQEGNGGQWVPVGSPVGQNQPPVPNGLLTQDVLSNNTFNAWYTTPITVAARYKDLRLLKRRDRGFESHLRHGCLCAFILCCPVRK